MADLQQWLAGLGLERYAAVFEENDVDLDILPDLTDHDLEQMGVSLGHRRRILKTIATAAAPATETPAVAAPSAGSSTGAGSTTNPTPAAAAPSSSSSPEAD